MSTNSRTPRCCSICRTPGHNKSHCPMNSPLPMYTVSDIEGMDVLQFLQGIFTFAETSCSTVYSREQTRFSSISDYYLSKSGWLDDNYYLSDEFRKLHHNLPIFRVKFHLVCEGSCVEYCYDESEVDEKEEKDVYRYFALPRGLVGDISSIVVSQFAPMVHTYCYCERIWTTWTVESIEPV